MSDATKPSIAKRCRQSFWQWIACWFSKWWWKYLLEKPSWYARGYCSEYWIIDWARRIWCRLRHHQEGPWYFTSHGYEPDMTCKNCGDEI